MSLCAPIPISTLLFEIVERSLSWKDKDWIQNLYGRETINMSRNFAHSDFWILSIR